jgi:hypothetical protein
LFDGKLFITAVSIGNGSFGWVRLETDLYPNRNVMVDALQEKSLQEEPAS